MLEAITPIDGRYEEKTRPFKQYFSEFGLIKYRVLVEIEYLLALGKSHIIHLSASEVEKLKAIMAGFTMEDAERIKDIEKTTNHDVKAVEYFIREKLGHHGMHNLLEMVHFGLTSQDINNTAIPLSLKDAWNDVLLPAYIHIVSDLRSLADQWIDIPMLAHTHGQPASPTRLGKELYVFIERLEKQLAMMHQIPWAAKFGGATGNFNAHHVAYPDVDWVAFADAFCAKIGLNRSRFTTQIEHYDMIAAHFHGLSRINTILIDLCRDSWTYISMEYFTQKIKENEVGSSAMPHKVNPIDFENAEGNLGLANAMSQFLADKLPVSRLQRDLTDSTVLRNIGVPYSYSLIACQSLRKGLSKLMLNSSAIDRDLDNNWAVLAEAIQTILRREQYPDPYRVLKDLTRGQRQVTRESLHSFIDRLDVSDAVKNELRQLTPHNYMGILPLESRSFAE